MSELQYKTRLREISNASPILTVSQHSCERQVVLHAIVGLDRKQEILFG